MFKNYIKIAFRNLLNKNGFSIINIAGLSIGMTCCLLIFQYVAFEYSFDRFHENKDSIYRVLQSFARGNEDLGTGHAYTAQALAPALKEGVPEIIDVVRIHSDNAIVSNPANPQQVFEDDGVLYADRGFINIFTVPLITGAKDKAILPGTALLSSSAAKKYFGTANPQGQLIDVTGTLKKTFTIGGVFQDVPANSHLQFDILLPMEDLLLGEQYANEPEAGWSWNNFTTYIQLHPNADLKAVEKKMTAVFLQHRGEFMRQQGARAAIKTQPLIDIHLNADVMGSDNIVTGSYRTVYFFLVIGLITLIIALVNYINLATARAINRSREVGVRKAIGARRDQLILQFMAESALTNLAAAVMALVLAAALMPVVNDLAETRLTIELWMNSSFWLAFLLTAGVGTLLAGLYPAFVLSSFRPATVLKGKTGYFSGHLWLRKSLVVIQFAASIVLLAGTAVVYNQLKYMRGMDIGLNLERVLTVRTPRVLADKVDPATAITTFLQEVKKLPGVQQAALSSSLPGQGFNWNGASIRKATDDPSKTIRGVATYIDSAFAPLYGLKLVAGKEFADITLSSAQDAPWMIMLNETAVKSLGYNSPAEAVDEALNIGGYNATVVGVYKDFKWSSAHKEQQPIVFGPASSGGHVSLRLATTDFASVIRKVQASYDALFPGNVFQYAFADQAFDQQYKNDLRFAKLFSISAGMTIFIACLGLFGLVAFTAQQRTKEIGMRKVLGATVANIVGLLSKDFLKLVVAGFVLAVPVTWYVMNKWLENFAYRINIGVGMFVVAGFTALLIALATVSLQAFKVATANPVNSLRNE